MGIACWIAAPDGRYWIDVALGTYETKLMIDVGMVDPQDQVAFEVEAALYDLLVQRRQVHPGPSKRRRDSSGQIVELDCGAVSAQLVDPATRTRVGPAVSLHIVRCFPKVPNRVGVVFFHHLAGCRVEWDLTAREWCVEYP
jgi:hypothetical protein